MKKLLLALGTIVLVACKNSGIEENINPNCDAPVFYAMVEDTKMRTYLDEDAKMRWTKDDRITIFVGENYNREFAFTGESGATAGGFSQKSADGFYTAEKVAANYAVYPHNVSTQLETDGCLKLSMPSTQQYAENSFGVKANTMVAVTEATSDMFLQFKNVCGYLKLNLYGENVTVKRIILQGNNDEVLAGPAEVTPVFEGDPTLKWANSATTSSLTLDCGEGIKIGTTESNATAFWLVVPPMVFEGGFTIRVVDINNKMYEKTTTSQQIITRNISKNMPALFVVCSQDAPADEGTNGGEDNPVVVYDVPNNQIWYKTKYDFAVTLPTETTTNANLMSHTYENGIGKLVFDNDVTTLKTTNSIGAFEALTTITHVWLPESLTSIEWKAFRRCTGLTSITLPESLTSIGRDAFSVCTGLTSITLPESLTSIEGYAFNGCTGLTSITLPESLTSIEGRAFYGCTGLVSVYCCGTTPPSWVYDSSTTYKNPFEGITATIFVPQQSLAAYQATDWGKLNLVGYDYEAE